MAFSPLQTLLPAASTYEPVAHHHCCRHPQQCLESSEENNEEDVDGEDNDGASTREQKGLREVDAGSLIAPILSRMQSSVLYAAATTPGRSPPRSVSPSSEEDEALGGVKRIKRASYTASAKVEQAQPQPPHHHHVNRRHKKSHPKNSFTLPLFQLPSLPRNVSLPSFVTGNYGSETMTEKLRRQRAKTTAQLSNTGIFSTQRSSTFFGRQTPKGVEDARSSDSRLEARPPPLRRSSSVSSMTRLSRAATGGSTTSSLGDDARFLHITQMTNSRLKAIKDNLMAGFPTMPQLPHLQQHLASLNPFTDSPENAPTTILPRSPAMEAMDGVTGDVVILGGYRGSILRDTATGRRVWIPLKVGFNLRKVDLAVGLEPEDEERASDKIKAEGMLKSISAVDISRRLMRRLKTSAMEHRRVHDWGYDWRVSPSLIVKRLISFLETLLCNQPVEGEDPTVRRKGRGALVIAHSLGGLIVRNAINQRPELFSGVVFAGTPMNCINVLGPLKNGDSVLFNSKVFTAQVNFTLRSSYAFLPENGHCFIDKKSGEPILIDFYDVNTWRKFGLSPCVSDVPPVQQPQPQTPISPLTRLSNASAVLQNLNPLNDTTREKEKEKEKDLSTVLSAAPQLNSASSSEEPTIPKSLAVPYLARTLADTLEFRKGLYYKPELKDLYPPMTVLYSKTTPTVRGAKVDGLEGIKRADVYDELVFGAGDGVCLSKAAMLPDGYRCVRKVAVDRGHVSLLGELEGVGACVEALVQERGW